jgi:hypothetical protein
MSTEAAIMRMAMIKMMKGKFWLNNEDLFTGVVVCMNAGSVAYIMLRVGGLSKTPK